MRPCFNKMFFFQPAQPAKAQQQHDWNDVSKINYTFCAKQERFD